MRPRSMSMSMPKSSTGSLNRRAPLIRAKKSPFVLQVGGKPCRMTERGSSAPRVSFSSRFPDVELNAGEDGEAVRPAPAVTTSPLFSILRVSESSFTSVAQSQSTPTISPLKVELQRSFSARVTRKSV